MEILEITTDFIKLDQALKKAGLVASGAEAKLLILDGEVRVNDEVCTMRGKKLVDSDRVSMEGVEFIVSVAGEDQRSGA